MSPTEVNEESVPGILLNLIWEFCAETYDADEMVGECCMYVRDLEFRHVARHTILRTYCASRLKVRRRRTLWTGMTLQTLLVVGCRIAHQRLMRIVASHASNPGVAASTPAKTSFQAVGL